MLGADTLEDRASDVRQRLEDLGLGDGVTEDDLLGGPPREPLRTCCLGISQKLWALIQNDQSIRNMPAVRSAVQDVQQSANTDAAAKDHLDSVLAQLVRTVNGEDLKFTCSRLDSIEILAGIVQARSMIRNKVLTTEGVPEVATLLTEEGQQHRSHVDNDINKDNQEIENTMECDDQFTLEMSSVLQNLVQTVGIDPRQQENGNTAASAVLATTNSLLSRLPSTFFDSIVPETSLTAEQKAILAEVNTTLYEENTLRRKMLIERAKVTLQSFLWSPRLLSTEYDEEIEVQRREAEAALNSELAAMSPAPQVTLAHVWASTLGDVMSVTERATSTGSTVRAKVKDVLIGSVPDRGGRTDGRRKISMPEWSERKTSGGGRGGGRGRGKGGRSGGGGEFSKGRDGKEAQKKK